MTLVPWTFCSLTSHLDQCRLNGVCFFCKNQHMSLCECFSLFDTHTHSVLDKSPSEFAWQIMSCTTTRCPDGLLHKQGRQGYDKQIIQLTIYHDSNGYNCWPNTNFLLLYYLVHVLICMIFTFLHYKAKAVQFNRTKHGEYL